MEHFYTYIVGNSKKPKNWSFTILDWITGACLRRIILEVNLHNCKITKLLGDSRPTNVCQQLVRDRSRCNHKHKTKFVLVMEKQST
jgi:hypothetical protein